MTALNVPDQPTFVSFDVGSGGQTAFPFSFTVFDKTNLRVKVGDVELTQADFGFSGTAVDGGYSGGTVTLNTAAASTTVIIWRDVKVVRTTNFAPVSAVRVPDVDASFNRVEAKLQDVKRDLLRSVRLPLGSTVNDLPSLDDLEGKALGIHAGALVGLDLTFDADVLSFASQATAAASTIAGGGFIRTAGFSASGDGGDALYAPAGDATYGFTTADGQAWEPAGIVVTTRQFGAFPSDPTVRVKVQKALDFLESKGGGVLVVDDADLLLDMTGANPSKYGLRHPSNVKIVPRVIGVSGFKVVADAGDYQTVIDGNGYDNTDVSGLAIDQNVQNNTTCDIKVGGNGPQFAVRYSGTNNRVDRTVIRNAGGINTIVVNGPFMTQASVSDNEIHFIQGRTTDVADFYDNSAIYTDGKDYDVLRNRVYNDDADYGSARCAVETHGANYRHGANTSYRYVQAGNVVGENVPSTANGFRAVQASCNIELYDNLAIDCRAGWQLWALDGAHLKGIRTRRNKAYRNPGLFPLVVDTHFCIGYHFDYRQTGDFEEDAADNVDVCVPYIDATAADASAGFMRMTYGNITLKSVNEQCVGSPNAGHSVMSGAGLTIGFLPAWSNTAAYQLLQRVSRASVDYECILAHTGHQPPNATYWKPIDPATSVARLNIRGPRSVDVGQNTSAIIRYHGILRGICIGEVIDAQIEDTGTGTGLTGVINGWATKDLVAGSDVTFPPAVSRVANSVGQRHVSQYHSSRSKDHAQQSLVQGATTVALVLYGGVRDFLVNLSDTGCQLVKDPAVDPCPPGYEFSITFVATAATSTLTFSSDFVTAGWVDFTGIGQRQTARFKWNGTKFEQTSPWVKL